jgi:hypothetical protein
VLRLWFVQLRDLRSAIAILLSLIFASTAFAMNAHNRSRRHHHHRASRIHRVVWNPLLRGSHDSLLRQNEEIDRLNLPRIGDDDELEVLEASHALVPIEDSRSLSIASNLQPNRRYCRPWTRDFVEDLGRAYYEEFHQPIQVTSAVRTIEQQRKLRRHNRNAAPEGGDTASSHLAGITVDILKRGMTRRQHRWVEEYFYDLKEQGLIEPEEERRQPVFHVAVSDRYTEWRDNGRVEAVKAEAPAVLRPAAMTESKGESQAGTAPIAAPAIDTLQSIPQAPEEYFKPEDFLPRSK